jgi:hypothetical protein
MARSVPTRSNSDRCSQPIFAAPCLSRQGAALLDIRCEAREPGPGGPAGEAALAHGYEREDRQYHHLAALSGPMQKRRNRHGATSSDLLVIQYRHQGQPHLPCLKSGRTQVPGPPMEPRGDENGPQDRVFGRGIRVMRAPCVRGCGYASSRSGDRGRCLDAGPIPHRRPRRSRTGGEASGCPSHPEAPRATDRQHMGRHSGGTFRPHQARCRITPSGGDGPLSDPPTADIPH